MVVQKIASDTCRRSRILKVPAQKIPPERKAIQRPYGHAADHVLRNNEPFVVLRNKGLCVVLRSKGPCAVSSNQKQSAWGMTLVAAEKACSVAMEFGMQSVDVFVKGPGPGRESAVRALNSGGLRINSISDITPIPHNGCRPPKRRRV